MTARMQERHLQLLREGVLITYGEAEIMNSKTEYHQPGVTRVIPAREVRR